MPSNNNNNKPSASTSQMEFLSQLLTALQQQQPAATTAYSPIVSGRFHSELPTSATLHAYPPSSLAHLQQQQHIVLHSSSLLTPATAPSLPQHLKADETGLQYSASVAGPSRWQEETPVFGRMPINPPPIIVHRPPPQQPLLQLLPLTHSQQQAGLTPVQQTFLTFLYTLAAASTAPSTSPQLIQTCCPLLAQPRSASLTTTPIAAPTAAFSSHSSNSLQQTLISAATLAPHLSGAALASLAAHVAQQAFAATAEISAVAAGEASGSSNNNDFIVATTSAASSISDSLVCLQTTTASAAAAVERTSDVDTAAANEQQHNQLLLLRHFYQRQLALEEERKKSSEHIDDGHDEVDFRSRKRTLDDDAQQQPPLGALDLRTAATSSSKMLRLTAAGLAHPSANKGVLNYHNQDQFRYIRATSVGHNNNKFSAPPPALFLHDGGQLSASAPVYSSSNYADGEGSEIMLLGDITADGHNQQHDGEGHVDGADVDEQLSDRQLARVREFAQHFKMRRLALGLTQTQVGRALTKAEGPSYSQSAICRFEKLDITKRSAQKIMPVLRRWMSDEERRKLVARYQPNNISLNTSSRNADRNSSIIFCVADGRGGCTNTISSSNLLHANRDGLMDGFGGPDEHQHMLSLAELDGQVDGEGSADSSPPDGVVDGDFVDGHQHHHHRHDGCGKKRKRRTSFNPQALDALNDFFAQNEHPSSREVSELAERLNYEREVVRVWFCNKRQAKKNAVRRLRGGSGQHHHNSGDSSRLS